LLLRLHQNQTRKIPYFREGVNLVEFCRFWKFPRPCNLEFLPSLLGVLAHVYLSIWASSHSLRFIYQYPQFSSRFVPFQNRTWFCWPFDSPYHLQWPVFYFRCSQRPIEFVQGVLGLKALCSNIGLLTCSQNSIIWYTHFVRDIWRSLWRF